MSTWHQRQPLKRALAEKKFVHPWAHPTEFQVIQDPPNQMAAGLGRYKTREEAYAKAAEYPHTYVIPPQSCTT